MEARDRYEFFAVYRVGDGSIKKFLRYIFRFYSLVERFIKIRQDKTTLFNQGSPISCEAGILRGPGFNKGETHVLLFTSISYECKYVSDQSMLVFCFRDHTFVVYLQTAKVDNNSVFKELTLLFLL